MANQLTVNIGNQTYQLMVEAGEAERVQEVARTLDAFVQKMIQAAPGMERDRLLVLSGLMMAEEYLSEKERIQKASAQMEQVHNSIAERLERLV